MRILRGLTSIAILAAGRDYGSLLEKARRLRGIDQTPAALTCLKEGLGDSAEDLGDRDDPDYAACHVLLAETQVECGLLRGDLPAVRAGLEMLLRVESRFPAYVTSHIRAWREILGTTDRLLVAALNRDWRPGSDKSAFRMVVGRLARAWLAQREPEAATLVCEHGAAAFPGDPAILYWQAEVAIAQGDLPRGLALAKESLASGVLPTSAPELITTLDKVIRLGGCQQEGEAEALKGEVLRRVGRWDDAYAALLRAEELISGALPDFAVEALLLAALRRGNLDEVERYGGRYGARGFGTQQMGSVASAVRSALDRSPDRKHLWLLWSQLCLHLGRLGESLQGVARTLGLDPSLAEGVLAGCRSLQSESVETPTFRLGLARVMVGSGDLQQGIEALRWFDAHQVSASSLHSATDLCREILARDPSGLSARGLLVRLLLRQGALDEALANGRLVFEQTGDWEEAATLSWRVGGAAQASTAPESGQSAREFEVEVWLKAGDLGAALEAVEVICAHPTCTRTTLVWAGDKLRSLPRTGPDTARIRLATAQVLRRLDATTDAAFEYLHVLRLTPTAEIVERACGGLHELLASPAGPDLAGSPQTWAGAGLDEAALRSIATSILQVRPTQSGAVAKFLQQVTDAPAQSIGAELGAALNASGADTPSEDAPTSEPALEEAAVGTSATIEPAPSACVEAGPNPVADDDAASTAPTLAEPDRPANASSPDAIPEPLSAAPSPAPEPPPAPSAGTTVSGSPRSPRQSLRDALARETVEFGAPGARHPVVPTPPPVATKDRTVPADRTSKSAIRDRLSQQTVEFNPGQSRRSEAPTPREVPSVVVPQRGRTPSKLPPAVEAEFQDVLEQALEAYRKKDYETARLRFERAQELNPEDRRVRYNLGLLAARKSRPPAPRPPEA